VAGNSPSLRNQRIAIYQRAEAGSDGFQRPVYSYLYTLWGRLDDARDAQVVASAPQAHTEYRDRVKATFNYTAVIPEDGIMLFADEIYFIRGILKRRQLWRTDVDGERVSAQQFAEFTLFEGASVADGAHLVDTSQA
jgi:hypothetical protein